MSKASSSLLSYIADNDISQAMNSYANMLRNGQGNEIIKSATIKYYSKAIEERNVPAIMHVYY